MPDPTDQHPVADDPSGIVQQMPEGDLAERLLAYHAHQNLPESVQRNLAVQVNMWLVVEAAKALTARRATEADLRAEVERLTRQLGQANAVGRAKGWEEAAAFLEGAKGVNDDGSEYDLSPSEFAAFALSGVRSFADAIAVLSPETDGGQDGR